MNPSNLPATPAQKFKFERLLAISDIHGHSDGLDLLLREAGYDPNRDQLILGGDYIDTDPDTWNILDRIIELTNEGAIALPGNHEFKLLALQPAARLRIESKLDWLRDLPPCAEANGFLFVHAGFRPGIPLEQQTLRDMIEIREPFWASSEQDFQGNDRIAGRTIVFGHTPTFKLGATPGSIWTRPGKIAIDTGAKHGLRLTLIDLTSAITYSCSTAPDRLYRDVRRRKFQPPTSSAIPQTPANPPQAL